MCFLSVSMFVDDSIIEFFRRILAALNVHLFISVDELSKVRVRNRTIFVIDENWMRITSRFIFKKSVRYIKKFQVYFYLNFRKPYTSISYTQKLVFYYFIRLYWFNQILIVVIKIFRYGHWKWRCLFPYHEWNTQTDDQL